MKSIKSSGRDLQLKMRGFHSAKQLIASKGVFYALDRLKLEQRLMDESYCRGFALAIKNSKLV
jgi:hypothetical protein